MKTSHKTGYLVSAFLVALISLDVNTSLGNAVLTKDGSNIMTEYFAGEEQTGDQIQEDSTVFDQPINPLPLYSNFSNNAFPVTRYFRNLRQNMPNNLLDNCGYTSLSMLLSFYDTFVNDSIIPENFEVSSSVTYLDYLNDSINYESPGVWELPPNGVSYTPLSEYKQIALDVYPDDKSAEYQALLETYVVPEINKYIESKSFLGYLFNMSLNAHILRTSSDPEYNEILQNKGNTYVTAAGINFNVMIALLTEYISHNHFLSSHRVTIDSYHISERSDSEYARLRAELISYLKRGIPVIVGGHKMDNSGGHSCIAYAYNGKTDTIYLNSGWKGTWNMIPASIGLELIEDFICLDFGNLLEHDCTHNYAFCPCGNQFTKHLIRESDYGFEQQYFYYEKEKEHVVDGLAFSTKRLRCGYIEQERINLSPRRVNAGTSFLQLQFSSANVQCISLDLSFWSEFEGLDSTNGSVLIQYASIESNWITAIDLLNDFKLSTNRYQHDTLSFSFYHTAIHYFRIIATSANISSSESRNKGRISIKNVNIYTLD